MKSKKLTLVLLMALGFLVTIQIALTVLEETANAQIFGSDRYMIVVNGTWIDNEEPVFVINTREETICVYEYNSEEDKMKLVAVRLYKWDRMLQEYNNDAPSVATIRSTVVPR
ncbi:MAG: hypothetical protein GXP25_18525 [Planctomycetes bacterium]|nr:hypothetical protein [Planctomycetota bacterium]